MNLRISNTAFRRKLRLVKKLVGSLSAVASLSGVGLIIFKFYKPASIDVTNLVAIGSIYRYLPVEFIAVSSAIFFIAGLVLLIWSIVILGRLTSRACGRLNVSALGLLVLAVGLAVGASSLLSIWYWRNVQGYERARTFFYNKTLPRAQLRALILLAQREEASGDLQHAVAYYDQASKIFKDAADVELRRDLTHALVAYAEAMHGRAETLHKRYGLTSPVLLLEAEAVRLLPRQESFRSTLESYISKIEAARARWPDILRSCSTQDWSKAFDLLQQYGWYYLERSQARFAKGKETLNTFLSASCVDVDVLANSDELITVKDVETHPTTLLARADMRWNIVGAKKIYDETRSDRLDATGDAFGTLATDLYEQIQGHHYWRFIVRMLISRQRVVDVMPN